MGFPCEGASLRRMLLWMIVLKTMSLKCSLSSPNNLGVDFCPAVEHGDDETFDRERGIDLVLDEPDGLEQFAETFEGEELRLDGNHDGIGGRQALTVISPREGEQSMMMKVIVVPDRGEPFLEDGFAVLRVQHLDLCARRG